MGAGRGFAQKRSRVQKCYRGGSAVGCRSAVNTSQGGVPGQLYIIGISGDR